MATNLTFEQQVLKLTNEVRAKNGLKPLQANAELNYAADKYAELMAQRNYFSHTGPDGSRPRDRAKAVGFEAQIIGENLGRGQKTAQEVVQAWMNSPGHRANILNPNYTQIGTGFEKNFWVQKFGTEDTNPATKIPTSGSQPAPTPTAPKPTPTTPTPTTPPTSGNNNQTFEQRVLELTNIERTKNGLKPLKGNVELNYAADKYAGEMAQRRVLSHTGPDGSKPWDRAKAVGFEAQTMGENIAAGQRTPEEVVQAWMNSPGHRANILNPNYTQIGTGFEKNFWVQKFGSEDRNPATKIPVQSISNSQPTSELGKELKGGDSNDVLTGGNANDVLWGGKGKDYLNGGDGNDRLIGGLGKDKLTGGTGRDTFVYESIQDKGDTITDFSAKDDVIDLRRIMSGPNYSGTNKFSDYLKLQQLGSDTVVRLDVDGNTKPAGLQNFIRLEKVNATSLSSNNFLV
jgi:uncharacterized protein YkwD